MAETLIGVRHILAAEAGPEFAADGLPTADSIIRGDRIKELMARPRWTRSAALLWIATRDP